MNNFFSKSNCEIDREADNEQYILDNHSSNSVRSITSVTSSIKLKEAKVKVTLAKLKQKQAASYHELLKKKQALVLEEELLLAQNEKDCAELEYAIWQEEDECAKINTSQPNLNPMATPYETEKNK